MGISFVKKRISDGNGRKKYASEKKYYISPNRVKYEYKGTLEKTSDGVSHKGALYRAVVDGKRLELQETSGGKYVAYVNNHLLTENKLPAAYSGLDTASIAAEKKAKLKTTN